ncbi:MAG: hypothetical protein RIQ52_1056 [Pseudomonadota bacterium]|jgi:GNAT superfamily N-acetyltransferase
MLQIKHLSGEAIRDYIPDLATLRITVFRDFPYLYDGTREYEEHYLETYLKSSESIVVLALDGDKTIGASTGLPMADETSEFQAPFIAQGLNPADFFYCAESVLLPEYRGRGVYKAFFEGREAHARRLGRFSHCTFCCVQRPADHPLRPQGYAPLDAVWTRFGYHPQPGLTTGYAWKDIDMNEETIKPMNFWIKALKDSHD